MDKVNFTKSSISNLATKDSRYLVGDTKCPGLCVRISPTGHKSYIVYKKLRSKPLKVTLGNTDDLTVEKARKKAQKTISQIAYEEADPNEQERRAKDSKRTLNEVFEEYIDRPSLAKNTINGYKLCINRDLKDWKNKSLNTITGKMVKARHKKLSKNSETSANKTMRVLRAIFNYARNEYEDDAGKSLFADNPTRKLSNSWNKESRRKGYIPPNQLEAWFTAVNELPNYMKAGDPELARDYFQFLLLNGLRRREATSLEWCDIDFKGEKFIVRNTKNRDDLWMPLTDYSIEVLQRRKDAGATRPFQIDDPRKSVALVRKKSNLYFTLHDLRRTFVTFAENMDIGVFTIKALVNHRSSDKDVTEGYFQPNTERLRRPLQQICNTILHYAKIKEFEIEVLPIQVQQLGQRA